MVRVDNASQGAQTYVFTKLFGVFLLLCQGFQDHAQVRAGDQMSSQAFACRQPDRALGNIERRSAKYIA